MLSRLLLAFSLSLLILGSANPIRTASAGLARQDVPTPIEGKRVALVIGNGDYTNLGRLPNPKNDANAVANAFKKFGFLTTLNLDVGRDKFGSVLREFGRQAAGAKLAIVFYSGHGFPVDEMNYLVPVDQGSPTDKSSLLSTAIPVSALVAALEGVPGPKLIILDVGRQNPFASKDGPSKTQPTIEGVVGAHPSRSQSGLASLGSDRNLLIAYSTRYGDIAMDGPSGGNSPYTESLIKVLDEPGLDVRIVFDRVRAAVYKATDGKQDPSSEGTLGSELVFINPKLEERISVQPGVPAPKVEEASKAFSVIKDSTSPAMLDAYAKLFPDTVYAEFARVRAEEIRKTAVVTPAVAPSARGPKRKALAVGIKTYDNLPPQRQLTKAVNDARAIAATLKELGFDVDKPSEDIDRRTFNVRWQEFLKSIQPGDEAVFYFSGHGVELSGLNYLVLRDVPPIKEGQDQLLKSESINFADLQHQLAERGPKMALFILDACRDNPFDETGTKSLGGRKGLAPVPEARGVFVMFAAGYQQAALDRLNDQDSSPNSVYTRKLLPLMKKVGLKLQDVAVQVKDEVEDLAMTVNHTQVPAYYDQLRGKFCLAGCE